MKLPYTFILTLLLLMTSLNATAQTQAKHPGVELFEKGKYSEALKSLEAAVKQDAFKSDAQLWNFLGLTYIEQGEPKKAIKSLEKANELNKDNIAYKVNLAYAYLRNRQTNKAQAKSKEILLIEPNNTYALYFHGMANLSERKTDAARTDAEKLLAADPTFVDAYILKADAIMLDATGPIIKPDEEPELGAALKEAVAVLQQGIAACGKKPEVERIKKELEAKSAFLGYYEKKASFKVNPGVGIPPKEEGVTPVKIISKPRASYTDAARQNGTQGSIQLAVLLGASGRVEYILRLSTLGNGLDESAIKAAKAIKFEPQMKDGKPVSVVKVFQYGFSIY